MRSRDQLKDNLPKTEIRSTVKFKWVFLDELSDTVDALADFLEVEIPKHYEIDFIDVGNKSLKIKINDSTHYICRVINCVFDNNQADAKYGNACLEMISNELSKKPRYKMIGKFNILDRDTINQKTLSMILKSLEEIYE